MSYSLLTYIYNSVWFLEESSQDGLYEIARNFRNGNLASMDFSEERAKHRAYVISLTSDIALVDENGTESLSNSSLEHSIAVIPIRGAITLQDQRCGPMGTVTIGQSLMDAAENPNIDSVILSIDSPGGEAHAMFDLSNSINEFKQKCNKPIVAFVGSMAASAAYGIAAACHKIVCSDENSVVGSIGSYVTILDKKKSMEADGIFAEDIYAADSSEKNIDIKEALEGNKKPILATLKKYNDRFKSIVTSGRPGITSSETTDPLKGASIFAVDALGMHLIDEIGNMSVAKKHCLAMSPKNYLSNNTDMTKISFKSTMLAIGSIFTTKVDGDEITEAEVLQLETTLGERQQTIDTLNTTISENETEISGLNTTIANLTESNKVTLAEMTTKRDVLQAELNRRPGTAATTPIVSTDPIAETTVYVVDEINEEAKKYRTPKI